MMATTGILATAPAPSLGNYKPEQGHSSLSSSPRQFPTDLTHPILEEGDETESEPPNEPVTPVSGRQSQDFQQLPSHESTRSDTPTGHSIAAPFSALQVSVSSPTPTKNLLVVETDAPPVTPERQAEEKSTSEEVKSPADQISHVASQVIVTDQDVIVTPTQGRPTRGSTSSFKRTMSSLFRRSNSQSDKLAMALAEGYNAASESNLQEVAQRKEPNRRWSLNKSSNTTRSNTPPSPGSPALEMASKAPATPSGPASDEMFGGQKKARATTGFSLRNRAVFFVGNANQNANAATRAERPARRRASSYDFSQGPPTPTPAPADPDNPPTETLDRQFWALPAASGIGVKARRMSLSLPDDFGVEVVELLSEFEYQHKILGRHGKHLGKGATSKVSLMVRKGSPTEMYAVKEFRGKSSRETHQEYESKVKSEYTLAKSLRHPNIVETVRLCTDHGRWNHVMEYCSEGDLFGLVNKKYLTREDREKDRLCLFKQLIQGIHYLHSNGIAHRDVKLENLLVTSDSKLKITDFGVSDVFSGTHPGFREAGGQCGQNMADVRLCAPGICGSEPYIAPEVIIKHGKYDPRALDVWSSAIVMIHLIFGGAMWRRADLKEGGPNYLALLKGWDKWNAAHHDQPDATISDSDYPKVMAFDRFVKPPALRRVLLQMLNPDPAKRISMADVSTNRWLKNIECCQLDGYEDASQMIDATKAASLQRNGQRKIFCHNHLPPKEINSHSLGKMPGSAGY